MRWLAAASFSQKQRSFGLILWRLVVTILALSLAKVVRQLHLTRCPALVYSGGAPVRCSGDGFLAVDDVKSLLTRAPPFHDACSS